MATNGVDPGGYYPPMSTSAPSGVGTDPYSPSPVIPTPPTAAPGPALPVGLGSGLVGPGAGYTGSHYYLEDGGAIPMNGLNVGDGGTRVNEGVNVGDGGMKVNEGYDPEKALSAVKDTMSFTRRKFMGEAFGQGSSEGGDDKPVLDLTHVQQPHLDEGGAVPDEDDVTGAIPDEAPAYDPKTAPVLSRERGLDVDAAVAQAPQQMDEAMKSGPALRQALNPATASGNAKAIWQYLTGANAAPPAVVDAAEKHVDPDDEMDPNDRKLHTIATVKADHGDDAASSVLQSYRQKYDHFKAFAGVAASEGHLDAAVNAATKAFTNLPDGHKIVFEASGDKKGVTAHIQGADGNKAGSMNLSLNQFSQFLKGKDSLFDSLMDQGSGAVLRKQFTGADEAKAAAPQSIPKQLAKQLGVSVDDVIRLYPSPKDQMTLLQQQKQQSQKNDIDMLKAKNPLGLQQLRNEGAMNVANTRGDTARDVQKQKSESWAKVYDLKDRNEQHKLLTAAAMRQTTDAGRNVMNMARGMLAQGVKMSDIDAQFKQKGIDLGPIMGVGVAPTVAAPTRASTATPQPGVRYDSAGRAWKQDENGNVVPAQ